MLSSLWPFYQLGLEFRPVQILIQFEINITRPRCVYRAYRKKSSRCIGNACARAGKSLRFVWSPCIPILWVNHRHIYTQLTWYLEGNSFEFWGFCQVSFLFQKSCRRLASCLRSAHTVTTNIVTRSEFHKSINIDKRDFAAIEYLLRKGRRQLDLYSAPGIKDIH